MDRREAVLALLALSATPRLLFAQQPGKVWHIGYLSSELAVMNAERLKALQDGFRDLGYVDGKNLVIESRWADGRYARLPALAEELIRLQVDAIVTDGDKASLAARGATRTIPIVIGIAGDPVALGLVASLARPGGNITGSSGMALEMHVKRLELLKEAIPHVATVAILLNPENSGTVPLLRSMRVAAKSLKVELQPIEVRRPEEIDGALSAISLSRANALVVHSDTLFHANAERIANLSSRNHLPSAGRLEFADAGGLIGYGPSTAKAFYRAAALVDKILKGAKPGDLPIEQPTKFVLVINLKTAKELGLTIPQSLMLRADQLIQ